MKIAVIGAAGQLGNDLCEALRGWEFVPLTHEAADVSLLSSVKEALYRHRPEAVVNCASFTNVEACEKEPEKGYLVNTIGAKNVATVCDAIGAKVVYISSDYVFGVDALRRVPYTEFDAPGPINILGRTKLAGEELVRQLCPRHIIVRTSSLFGKRGSRAKGGNFVETIIRLATERGEVRVVNDQIMSPTYSRNLAEKIVQLLAEDEYGTFHVTNAESCSWFDFAEHIIRTVGIPARCIPISASEYPSQVRRPSYSVLDHFHLRLLGMNDLAPWSAALKEYVTERDKSAVT